MSKPLSSQSVDALRKKYIAMVKSTAAPQTVKQQAIAKASSMTKAQLVAELSAVLGQGGGSSTSAKASRKSRKSRKSTKAKTSRKSRTSAKARGTRKSRTRQTKGGAARLVQIPKSLKVRVAKILSAIKSGRVVVKQGKASPSAFPLQDARDRYEAFAALYADVRITRKSRKSTKVKTSRKSRKSIKAQTKTSRKSRKSAKARTTRKSRTRTTKSGAARAVKIPKTLRARVGKIVRAIKSGRVAVKQGKASPSNYALQDARDRYTAFASLYADARITRKSRKSRKTGKSRKTRTSVKALYAKVQGQKYPYMLKKGYRVPSKVVGGGARGAGVITTIPGSKATPFSQLSAEDQAKVVAFLNSEKGKKLRGKGAGKKTVSLQAIRRQASAQKQRRASRKSRSRTSMKGAANRR